MSDPVRPQRWQPTRLRHPWDSPGKNTGVGCHFLLQCMKVQSERSRSVVSDSLQTPWTAAHQAPRSMGFSRQEFWSGVPLPSPTLPYMGPNISEYLSIMTSICYQSFSDDSNENAEVRTTAPENYKILNCIPGISLVVKTLPCHATDRGSIPGQGTKIPHATGQLGPSPSATTEESTCCNRDPVQSHRFFKNLKINCTP